MADLPIIIIHFGQCDYLNLCLRQARRSNPHGRIILLGDEDALQSPPVKEGLSEGRLFEITPDIEQFRNNYVHISPFKEKYERFCIERWLLLRNLIRQEKIDQCLNIDSDVLLFADMSAEQARFNYYDLVLSRWGESRYSGGCCFINSPDCLEELGDSILSVYSNPDQLDQIRSANPHAWSACGYWVSDMSLLYNYAVTSNRNIGFIEETLESGIVYDRAITMLDDFKQQPGTWGWRACKQVVFRNGAPFFVTSNGKEVPAALLHYHGFSKYLMPIHYTRKNQPIRAWLGFVSNELRAAVKKLRTKLGKS